MEVHDLVSCPKNAVAMKLFAWIKPQPVSLFTTTGCATITVDVCLKPPWLPSYVSQKLQIQLIMSLGEHIYIRCLHQNIRFSSDHQI